MSSKRTYLRSVQKEQMRLRTLLRETESLGHDQIEMDENPTEVSIEANVHDLAQSSHQTLRDKLQDWFLEYQPSVRSCSKLLKILKSENMDVPTSVGGLIRCNKNYAIKPVAPGEDIHIGIEKQLRKIEKVLLHLPTNTILMDIGIDGLPLFKSSGVGLWPILGKLVNVPDIDVFLIGTYVGTFNMNSNKKSQQKNSNSDLLLYLKELEKKLDSLKENFENFKNDIKNHNSMVINVLGENNIAIKSIIKYQNPKYKKMFPIKSIYELSNINSDINETNEQEYIATIKGIAGTRELKKGLADIIVPEVLVKFNVDGTHDKLRLLNYHNFINILFLATYEKNCSEKSFKEDLKYAIKLAKNRFFKNKMKDKILNNTNTSTNVIEETDNTIDTLK